MRILDLFCGAGGAAMGYHRAGFEVVGVDIRPQPNYPFAFKEYDALEFLCELLMTDPESGYPDWEAWALGDFDAIHASPPCQAYTQARRLQGNEHPDLIAETRQLFIATGLPYVIENVPGSPLIDPAELCGAAFGLRTYRHRLFETNFPFEAPLHHSHIRKQTKMGRPPVDGEFMQVVGNFSDVEAGRWAMGIDWMTRNELSEAIPPAYTAYVGTQLRAHLGQTMAFLHGSSVA
jgi:DNA (cytosine-5)-methyltransferase 1